MAHGRIWPTAARTEAPPPYSHWSKTPVPPLVHVPIVGIGSFFGTSESGVWLAQQKFLWRYCWYIFSCKKQYRKILTTGRTCGQATGLNFGSKYR